MLNIKYIIYRIILEAFMFFLIWLMYFDIFKWTQISFVLF